MSKDHRERGTELPYYVVTEPESIRGVYESWPECQARLKGVSGTRYQRVETREAGEAMLAGAGVVMPLGLYAFTDGNALGGVGVVVVRGAGAHEPIVLQELATNVCGAFSGAGIRGLASESEVVQELARLANILAEMAALYAALGAVPEGAEATVVHDYEGVSAFMDGRWRAKEPIRSVTAASWALAEERSLGLAFRHQRGHRSTWAGRDDFARFNRRADELATEGGMLAGCG